MAKVLDEGLALAGRAVVAAADAMRAGPRLTVLIFHRVHATTDPHFGLEPTAERFDRTMAMVARGFTVWPLERAAACAGELEAFLERSIDA
jgi:hypothetical protein